MKKIRTRISQGAKRRANALCVACIALHWVGCSTASRAPSPTQVTPVENAQQLAPGTASPVLDGEGSGLGSEAARGPGPGAAKKIDPAYSQDQASYHFSMG